MKMSHRFHFMVIPIIYLAASITACAYGQKQVDKHAILDKKFRYPILSVAFQPTGEIDVVTYGPEQHSLQVHRLGLSKTNLIEKAPYIVGLSDESNNALLEHRFSPNWFRKLIDRVKGQLDTGANSTNNRVVLSSSDPISTESKRVKVQVRHFESDSFTIRSPSQSVTILRNDKRLGAGQAGIVRRLRSSKKHPALKVVQFPVYSVLYDADVSFPGGKIMWVIWEMAEVSSKSSGGKPSASGRPLKDPTEAQISIWVSDIDGKNLRKIHTILLEGSWYSGIYDDKATMPENFQYVKNLNAVSFSYGNKLFIVPFE